MSEPEKLNAAAALDLSLIDLSVRMDVIGVVLNRLFSGVCDIAKDAEEVGQHELAVAMTDLLEEALTTLRPLAGDPDD